MRRGRAESHRLSREDPNGGSVAMPISFDRRQFVKALSAAGSLLDLRAAAQNTPRTEDTGPRTMAHAVWVGGHATKIRPNVVAIQTKPFCWNDEGIENVLDNLQKKGAVNTVYSYTYGTDPNRIHEDGRLPGHGKFGPPGLRTGGGYFDYDPKFFLDTNIKEFRSSDDGRFNVISDVAPKMKARGMDYFALDFNNPFPVMMKTIPGYSEVSEIDMDGMRTTTPCYNHPSYRAFLQGKIEVYLKQYAEYDDGIMWSAENMGPFRSEWNAHNDTLLQPSELSRIFAGQDRSLSEAVCRVCRRDHVERREHGAFRQHDQIGRASCRE